MFFGGEATLQPYGDFFSGHVPFGTQEKTSQFPTTKSPEVSPTRLELRLSWLEARTSLIPSAVFLALATFQSSAGNLNVTNRNMWSKNFERPRTSSKSTKCFLGTFWLFWLFVFRVSILQVFKAFINQRLLYHEPNNALWNREIPQNYQVWFPQKHPKTGSHFMIFPLFSSGRRRKKKLHGWVHHWWHASSWRTKSSQGANLWGWMKTPIPTVGPPMGNPFF